MSKKQNKFPNKKVENFFLAPKKETSSSEENVRRKIAMRLYGIQEVDVATLDAITSIENSEIYHEYLTNHIHQTKSLAHHLAYRSHNGENWQLDSAEKMNKKLLQQFNGGRAAEVIMTEALMLTNKEWYHFLPVKEMDLNHKVDMISRIPVQRNNSFAWTIAFGTQLTVAPVIWISWKENVYEWKKSIVKSRLGWFEDEHSRMDLAARHGALTVPDIISFIALNGSIGKTFINTSDTTTTKFFEWKHKNFELNKWMLGRFKRGFREDILLLAEELSNIQKFIVSEDFLENIQKNFHETRNFDVVYKKEVSYNTETRELTLIIYKEWEILMRADFFITPKVQEILKNTTRRDQEHRKKLKNFKENQ